MNLLSVLNVLFLFVGPVNTTEAEIEPIDFRVQVYPYSGHYSYPPTCPPGYYYGPGFGYRRRGLSFWGPGYYGGYNYGCYDRWGRRYYGPGYYPNRGRYYRHYPGPRRHYYRHHHKHH